jgi:hypothetical protein
MAESFFKKLKRLTIGESAPDRFNRDKEALARMQELKVKVEGSANKPLPPDVAARFKKRV